MRTLKKFLLVLILVSSGPLTSEAKTPPKKVLDIKHVESETGLTAWLVEDHTIPVISLRFAFQGMGSKTDLPSKQGLARLVSNTMDEGAGDLDSETFQKTLNDEAITLQFSINRDHFFGELKTLTRNKDKAFEMLALSLSKPRFDTEPVDRMRASNLSRIKSSLTNPSWMAARIQNDKIYEDHAYALNSGGTLSTLENITRKDLIEFHQNLSKEQLVISVAGDITADEVSILLDQLFSKLTQGKPVKSADIYDTKNQGKTYIYEQNIPQSVIRISQPGIRRSDDDYHAASVMNFILGESGFGSRLMEEIREKRGLTYGIYSYFQEFEETDGLFISTSTINSSVADMLSLIHNEWTRMKNEPVPENELKDAKSYLIGSLPLSFTSTNSIAGMLVSMQLEGLPIDYLDQRENLINNVSTEDIQNAAKRILNKDAFTTVIVGKPENIEEFVKVEELPNVK